MAPVEDETIRRGRAAFARQAWAEAFAAFVASAEAGPLDAADYERMAVSAYLIGEDDACSSAWEAAQRRAVAEGDIAGAARCAFWLSFILMMRGQSAHGAGWLTRTEALVADAGHECPASGYVLIIRMLEALAAGDVPTASDRAVRALELGERFEDADLRAFGTLARGQTLIATGDVAGGVAQLDSVMVSVTAGEVGPITSGIVYCAVILECMQLFDLKRAAEWTDALSSWCDVQPDLVPYRGQCLVHRSQLQQAAGDWAEAISSARAASRRLTDPPHPALGLARYQEGELHRLRGEFEEAEVAYRQASRSGFDPMPGLALLQLARGDASAATATLQRALREAGHPLWRPPLLAAAVDAFRATGEAEAARSAADELAQIAASSRSEVLDALSARATGTVLLAEGDPGGALVRLRAALKSWQSLRMPYEAARTATLVGQACAALGDRTAAALEFDNARDTFAQLGALPDVERVAGLAGGSDEPEPATPVEPAGLSNREREVLRHLAGGRTNRQIAAELVISPHTVARHVENIYAKLGVTTRAAATAYAYEHHLV